MRLLPSILTLLSTTTALPDLYPIAFVSPGTTITRYISYSKRRILESCRPTNGHDVPLAPQQSNSASHIVSITSRNIAGIKNQDNSDGIDIRFTPLDETAAAGLVAITGESGSGKSLLISKAIDLVTGGKVVASLLSSSGVDGEETPEACVELVANLHEPHLSVVSSSLKQFGVDPEILYKDQSKCQLHLTRTIQRTGDASGRMKTLCRINGKHVSLKTLRCVASPLFTRVDVATASAALARPTSRLMMIDTGVSAELKQACVECKNQYEKTKKRRRQIEKDLEERILPVGMQRGNGPVSEEDMEILSHWIFELDNFESKISTFREAILSEYNEVIMDSNDGSRSSNLGKILQNLRSCSWADLEVSEQTSLFANLLEFREEVKAVETKLASAHSAYEMLSSISSPESAVVALEKVRKLLYGISSDDVGPLFDNIEKTHELLNNVEESLNNCARSIDGNSDSVMSTLGKLVCTGISMEHIDTIVADWNSLARKHGIPPYLLPKCHESLRQELDGNAEALSLLPEAKKDEQLALEQYSAVCKELSNSRNVVANSLSESVTELLPSLGLEGTTFQVQMGLRPGGFEDPYCGTDSIGADTVDFLLLRQQRTIGVQQDDQAKVQYQTGGCIDQVGSSGEKSRVLLAIETALPGSIGTTCNTFSASSENLQRDINVSPLAIIYDEIDAHVGGRAAISIAKLLSDQTRTQSKKGTQILAISHSAPVAAIADTHIVIERSIQSEDYSSLVRAFAVDGSRRSKEIARMASGDLAVGEAEAFADALIRDALLQKNR